MLSSRSRPEASHEEASSLASLSVALLLTSVLVVNCIKLFKISFHGSKKGKSGPEDSVNCTKLSIISVEKLASEESTMSRFLLLPEFKRHYQTLVADSCYKLSEEFESLRTRGDLLPSKEANRGINRSKNRFVNVQAFDHTRVRLHDVDGSPGSDYINANYVSGYFNKQEYIATQGPLETTVPSFWQMIWESNTLAVVMLTRTIDKGLTPECMKYEMIRMLSPVTNADREKCFNYLPRSYLPEMQGKIEVSIVDERLDSYKFTHRWIVTELRLRCGENERLVRHYNFITWPDFDTVDPPEALVHFVKEVRSLCQYNTSPPIVVHCSAGVGRTGTFIAADIAMNQIYQSRSVNVPGIVRKMRTERMFMVQTDQQYHCIYKSAMVAAEEMLACMDIPPEPMKERASWDEDEAQENGGALAFQARQY